MQGRHCYRLLVPPPSGGVPWAGEFDTVPTAPPKRRPRVLRPPSHPLPPSDVRPPPPPRPWQPVHWASTRGHADIVRFLLSSGCDIDAVDVKQTTPLAIAAQYDHTVLVFFLVKEGADISKTDECDDSALHWAAYKGNLQTTALLHYLGLPADSCDSYGSTPLHLATSRNAPNVIEYLLDESSADPTKLVAAKDNKGRTPLDIAKERGFTLCVRPLVRANPDLKTRLMNAFMGTDGSKVMFYFYLINGSLTYLVYALVFMPALPGPEYALQHQLFWAVAAIMQLCYARVHCSSPGEIPNTSQAREAYEAALADAAAGTVAAEAGTAPLCHTCRIVKPLRSKHCTTAKRCIPMFDHYCPYIANTVGGANYAKFVAFIVAGLFGVAAAAAAALQHLLYVKKTSVIGWLMVVVWVPITLMALLMNQYHATLILKNLTTNEDINRHRYAYLRDDHGKFANPFSKGPFGNCMECCRRGGEVTADPYCHSKQHEAIAKAEEKRSRELHAMPPYENDDEALSTNDEKAALYSNNA